MADDGDHHDDDYGADDDFEADAGEDAPAAAAAEPQTRNALADEGDDDGGSGEPRRDVHDADVKEHEASPPAPAVKGPSRIVFDSDSDQDEEEEEETQASAKTEQARSQRAKPTRRITAPLSPTPRALRDDSGWTFTIHVRRIRGLRVPVAAPSLVRPSGSGAPDIAELHVFATVDKQGKHSLGSTWKEEAVATPPTTQHRRRNARDAAVGGLPSPGMVRRSGLLQEATWKHQDGVLTWKLSQDTFRHLKAYTPRLKLLVYGVGDNMRGGEVPMTALSPAKSMSKHTGIKGVVSCGWFFLDLRTPDLPWMWIKLQNAPFGGEVQVSTSFQITTSMPPHQSTSFRARTNSKSGVGSSKTDVIDAQECLQLGTRNGRDIFIISILIQGCYNVLPLAKSVLASHQSASRVGFWLSYSLFGIVVQTDVFYNLRDADFPPIRDFFRVRSCIEDVQDFIQTQQSVSVYLCTDNMVLADVELPLSAFLRSPVLREGSTSDDETTVEGTYLFASNPNSQLAASVSLRAIWATSATTDEQPVAAAELPRQAAEVTVGPSVSDEAPVPEVTSPSDDVQVAVDQITVSKAVLASLAGDELYAELCVGAQVHRSRVHWCAFTHDKALGYLERGSTSFICKRDELSRVMLAVRLFRADCDDAFVKSVDTTMDFEAECGQSLGLIVPAFSSSVIGECSIRCRGPGYPSLPASFFKHASDRDGRMYRVFCHFKEVRDLKTSGPCVVTFNNPFTGLGRVSSDVFTAAEKKGSVRVPNAYCSFVVVASPEDFENLMQHQLVMKLIRSKSPALHEEVGAAVFSLQYLFLSQQTHRCAEDSCGEIFRSETSAMKHWHDMHSSTAASSLPAVHPFKSCSLSISIMSDAQSGVVDRIGFVQLDACVEDCGLVTSDRSSQSVIPESFPEAVSMPYSRAHKNLSNSNEQHVKVEDKVNSILDAMVLAESDSPKVVNRTIVSKIGTEDEATDAQVQKQLQDIELAKLAFLEEKNAWKQEQKLFQMRWRRKLAEMEKARMDELEDEWARREEERSGLLKQAQLEYQDLEQKLRLSLQDVEARERKLIAAEAAFQRDRRVFTEETELAKRRQQTEHAHAMLLAKKNMESLEQRARTLEEQLMHAERRTKQVEADFADYRMQQRKVPEARLREEIASLKGQLVELERQKVVVEKERDQAEAKAANLKLQLDQAIDRLRAEKKKYEARSAEELEKLRLKYVAREEKYVLDGDREELRAIKRQLDELRRVSLDRKRMQPSTHHSVSKSSATRTSMNGRRTSPVARRDISAVRSQGGRRDRNSLVERLNDGGARSNEEFGDESGSVLEEDHDWNDPSSDEENAEPVVAINQPSGDHSSTELKRLERERHLLLSSGAYTEDSALVRELDRLILLSNERSQRVQL